jgi:outer membrane protein assembly factor BamB
MDGDGILEVVGPGFRRAPDSPAQDVQCLDARTGRLLWKLALPGGSYYGNNAAHPNPPGIPVAGDVDGDGRDEVLFSIGKDLYCVGAAPDRAAGAVEWTLTLPAPFAFPAIADTLGDGRLQVVAVCSDGFVYGIGEHARR